MPKPFDLARIAVLTLAFGAGCGSAAPIEPLSPSRPVAPAPKPDATPAPSDAETPLPTACERAAQKISLAKKLGGQGFALRENRLLEQAGALCPQKRDEARALVAKEPDARESGDALWTQARAARARGDGVGARRLASQAARAYRRTGAKLDTWSGLAKLHALALSHDGARLLAASADGELVIANARTLEPEVFLDVAATDATRPGRTTALFSGDGATVGILEGGGVTLYDAKSGARGKHLAWADERIETFAFSKDGRSVFTGGEVHFDAIVRRFDLRSGDALADRRIADAREITALAVSAADGSVAVGSRGGTIEILQDDKLEPLRSIGKKLEAPEALAFSPSGDTLAAISGGGSLAVWNVTKGTLRTHAPLEHPWGPPILGFSADGARVRVSGGTWGDALLDIDATSGRALSSKKLPQGNQVLSPDASVVAVSPSSAGLYVVDATSGNVIAEAVHAGSRLEDLAVTDGGLAFAREIQSGADSRIELFVASTRGETRLLEVPGYKAALAFSRRGQRLAGSFGGRGVMLWEVASGKSSALPDFADWVDALAFDGIDRLQAAGGPFELRVASLQVGASTWKAALSLSRKSGGRVLDLGGDRLALATDEGVELYQLGRPEPRLRLTEKDVRALAISADSHFLFVVSSRGTERIALADGGKKKLLSGRCQSGPIRVSADGSVVLVGCSYRELDLITPSGTTSTPVEVDRAELTPSGDLVVTAREGRVAISGRDSKERVSVELGSRGVAVARAPNGEVEWFGKEPAIADRTFCRVDRRVFPFELCEDSFYRDELVSDALVAE